MVDVALLVGNIDGAADIIFMRVPGSQRSANKLFLLLIG